MAKAGPRTHRSFSAESVGFYLQLEDEMTPTLKSASRAYTRFTKFLDVQNRRAVNTARKGFSQLTALIESFEELPKKAVDSYRRAVSEIERKIKPITQTFNFVIDSKSKKQFTTLISGAISSVFGKATLKLATTKEALGSSKPAFVGMLDNLPHFKQGGVVTAGAGKGIDDVLAVLGKGEMVLPADAAKQLTDLIGRSQDAAGHFAKLPTEIKKSYAEVLNLAKSLEILKTQAELGLDPEAAEKFEIGLKAADTKSLDLAKTMTKLGFSTAWMNKAVGAVKDLRNNFASLEKQEKENVEMSDKLFIKALGKEKFDALSTKLTESKDRLGKLKDSFGEAGEKIGVTGERLGTTYENFLSMNKILGMSKGELDAYRSESAKFANSIDGATYSMEEFTDAQKDLLSQNFDKQMAMKLAPAVAMFSQATGVSRDAVADLASQLSFTFHMSEKDIQSYLANLRATGVSAGVVPEQLFSAMQKAGEGLSSYLQTLGPEQSKIVLENTAKLAAVLESQSKGLGEKITGLIGEAASGNTEALGQLAIATGRDLNQIKNDLTSGDLTGFLASMQNQLKGLADNKDNLAALHAFADATGLSADELQKASLNAGSMNVTLTKMQGQTVTSGNELKYLAEQSAGTKTWIKTLTDGIDRFAQSLPGVSGVVGFFKENNPIMIASLISIGKEGFNAAAGLFGLAKSGLQWIGVLSSTASAAQTAAAATGPAGLAGATTGLGSTLSGVGSTVKGFFSSFFELIGEAGKGIGNFIYGIFSGIGQGLAALGTGIGGAIASIMTGVAAGFVALAPALVALIPGIPVILTLSLAAVALGAALWLAAPALEVVVKGAVALAEVLGGVFVQAVTVVGDVIKTVFGKAMDTFLELFNLNPLQVSAIGLSLIPFAAGMTALGIGVAAFGYSSLLAVPGLLALGTTLAIFGALNGNGVGGVISSLADSFQIDPAKMTNALRSMGMATKFIVDFAALSVILTGLGVASGVGGVVDSILGFFGVDSPLQALAKEGQSVAGTLQSLLDSFAGLANSTSVKSSAAIAATLAIGTKFIRDLSPMIAAVKELGALTEDLEDGFFSDGPLTKIDRVKGKFFAVVSNLMSGARALTVGQDNPFVTLQQSNTIKSNVDDKTNYEAEQVEQQKQTNGLLGQILDALSAGRGSKAVNFTGVQNTSSNRGELSNNLIAGVH